MKDINFLPSNVNFFSHAISHKKLSTECAYPWLDAF